MNVLDWLQPFSEPDCGFTVPMSLTLLHFLWQGCVIAAVVYVIGWLLQRSSATVRYWLHVGALLLMVACVSATFAIVSTPENEIDTTSAIESEAPSSSLPDTGVVVGLAADPPVIRPKPDSATGDLEYTGVTAEELGSLPETDQPADVPVIAREHRHDLASTIAGISPWLTGFYFAGVAMMLFRLTRSLWSGHRLRRESTVVDDEALLAMIERQTRRLGLKTAPAVALCHRVTVLTVIGIIKPVILLPASLAMGLAPQQLEALLAHELAHIRRFDLVVNLLQRLVEALLFFHPAVWFVSRRVSIERERACDDTVIAAGWQRVNYADALVRMAELCNGDRNLATFDSAALLAASGGRSSQLKRRVLRILGNSDMPALRLTRGGLVFLMLLLASFALAPAVLQSWAENAGRASDLSESGDEAVEATKPADSRPNDRKGRETQETHARQKNVHPVESKPKRATTQTVTKPSFQPLGFLPDIAKYSWGYGLSGDGQVVIGNTRNERTGFRWTHQSGLNAIPKLDGGVHHFAQCVSGDGTAIAGFCNHSPRPNEFRTAFLWTARDGIVSLGHLPGGTRRLTEGELHQPFMFVPRDTDASYGSSRALAISDSGSKVVGGSSSKDGFQAFVWTRTTGMRGLGDLPGGEFSSCAYGISADGRVIVGEAHSDRGDEAVRWIDGDGPHSIGDHPGGMFDSRAYAASRDGSVIVGAGETDKGHEAFRWTEDGMIRLGELPGGDHYSSARAVSANGSVIVGTSRTDRIDEAFIWDAERGMQNLRELLVESSPQLAEQLEGWRLTEANGVSSDGRVIAGVGVNPNEDWEAWIVTLPSRKVQSNQNDNRADAPPNENKTVVEATFRKRADAKKPQPSQKLGTLTGRFLYDGEPPKPEKISISTERRTRDGRLLGPSPRLVRYSRLGLTDQSLIVGKDQGIKNIVVWIRSKDVPVPPRTEPGEKPVLRAAGGRFEPRLLVFQAPDTLVLKNEETTVVNFNWAPLGSVPFNRLVTAQQRVEHAIERPSVLPGSVKSHYHPWMKSWLFPCKHPYFAASADDGTFRIENLPLGEWEFWVWHERTAYLKTDRWPKGRFTLKIEAGTNDLGDVKLHPDVFEEKDEGESAAKQGTADSEEAKDPQPSQKLGTLTGRFLYDGEPPKPEKIHISTERRSKDNRSVMTDPQLVHYSRLGLPDQSLIVGRDRGIKNIVVWIRNKDVPIPPRTEPGEKPVLRATGGQFEPRLLVFQAPHTLVLKNEETEEANVVNFCWLASVSFNRQVPAQQTVEHAVERPSVRPGPVSCSYFHWMKSWLFACRHPYFAVSAGDGTFRIGNLPLGEWEFYVWHERTGYLKTEHWPKGRFTLKIEAGTNALGVVKLPADLFKENDEGEREEKRVAPPADDASAPESADRQVDDAKSETVDHLIERFSTATYSWEQLEVARELIALGDTRIIPEIQRYLDTEDRRRRCNAGLVLAGLGDKRGLAIIIHELQDKAPRPTELTRSDGKPYPEGQIKEDRYYAAFLLGQLGNSEAVPALIQATKDETINYRAAMSLGEIGDRSAIPALREMAKDFPEEQLWAGYGLAALGEQEGFDILTNVILSDSHWTDRRHAVEALGKIGHRKAVPTVVKALEDKHVNVRVSAARALGAIRDPAALPALTKALSDTEATKINQPTTVENEARKAIEAIKSLEKREERDTHTSVKEAPAGQGQSSAPTQDRTLAKSATTGQIDGQLADQEGEAVSVAGSVVFLCDAKTGYPVLATTKKPLDPDSPQKDWIRQVWHAVTDERGAFGFKEVPLGHYRLVAQTWQGTEGIPWLDPEPRREPFGDTSPNVRIDGVAEGIELTSETSVRVTVRKLGNGVLKIVNDPKEANAFLLVSRQRPIGDPVLGPEAWGEKFFAKLIAITHMSEPYVVFSGLPDGQDVHVGLINYDNSVGVGGGSYRVGQKREVSLRILARWSNGHYDPPDRLRELVEHFEEHSLGVSQLIGLELTDAHNYKELRRILAEDPNRMIDVEGLGEFPFVDLLAASNYKRLRASHRARRERLKRVNP